MQLVLLRHPPVQMQPGLCYGRLDLPLQGELAPWLRRVGALEIGPVEHVWTSPARRCRIFAEAIARGRRLTAGIDERLQELDFGAWEGRSWTDVPRHELDRWAADPLSFAPPGGESGQQLLDRVASVCAELRQAGANAMVVTHGGPLRVMPALLRDEPPDLLAPPIEPGGHLVLDVAPLPRDQPGQHDALHR